MSRHRILDGSAILPLGSGVATASAGPLVPLRARLDRRRLGWLVGVSLALHLDLLALALFWPHPTPLLQDAAPGEVSIVFDDKPATTPSQGRETTFNEAPPDQADIPSSLPPPPPSDVPPDPQAAMLTPQQETAPAPPAEPPPAPAPPAPAAPPAAVVPPVSPSRPVVRTQVPRDEQAALPLLPPPVPIPPAPAPLPLPPAARPAPASPAPSRPASRAPPPGDFPRPMDFSFGGSIANAQPRNAPQTRRGLNLAYGSTASGRTNLMSTIRGGNLSVDYQSALRSWWLEHRYYPDQALMNGEDGVVGIKITVARDGRVRRVELESRSGSHWLDMAGLSTFRNAKLPPFPPDMAGDETTFSEDLHYILIR